MRNSDGSVMVGTADLVLETSGLDGVVEHRGRAVVVDVSDLLARASRSLERQRHRAHDLFPLGVHLHAVIRVARRSVAVDRRIDARAARPRAVLALEHDHPRAFAEDEPVPRAIERPRRLGGRVVVPRRDGAHSREPEDHAGRDARVRAARQDHVGIAGADERGGIANRVGGTGAAGGHDVADAVQLERDRDLARDHAHDRHGDRVRRHALPAVVEEFVVLPLGDVDAARAAADEDPRARFVEPQPGILPRLRRGDDGDERGTRIPAGIGPGTPFVAVAAGAPGQRWRIVDGERGHRRRDRAGKGGRVELGDGARGAAATADVRPEPFAADAVRGDDADA